MTKKTLSAANVEIRKGQMITGKTARPGGIPVIAGGKSPAYYHDKANRFAHTITISGSGASAGYLAFHEHPIYASDCSTIEAGEGYDLKYLYYALLAKQAEIYAAQTGGAQPHIHPKDLAPIECNFPPLAEQQKIAAVLSDIDALIETQEALIAKKKDVKAATMELLLTGKKRLPGFNDEWIKTPIKNMATIGRGRVISHAEISRSMAKEFPVYSSQTSNDGIMGYIDSFDFEGEYVTWTTDGANAGRVFHRTGKFNCTNVCGALSCLPNVSAMFLASALNRVTRFSVSTNLANPKLMNGVMGGIRVDMPQSLAEQVAISALLHDFQLEIDIQETLLLKQKLRKSSVMHKLLTGEIRLP